MENHAINMQFFIISSSVTCGILSLLHGGMGRLLPDEVIHLLVFIAVAYINFYITKLNLKKHRIKSIFLIIMISIYGSLISPSLLILAPAIQTTILIIPDRKVFPLPDISKDSPLSYGLRYYGIWKKLFCLLYAVIMVILT